MRPLIKKCPLAPYDCFAYMDDRLLPCPKVPEQLRGGCDPIREVFSGFRIHCFLFEQSHINWVHPQFWHSFVDRRNNVFPAFQFNSHFRNGRFNDIGIELQARMRIKLSYSLMSSHHSFLRNAHGAGDCCEVVLDEQIEMEIEDSVCRGSSFPVCLELQHQTLAKITRGHASRVERLNDAQRGFDQLV